jgi:hypothetical protein
MEVEPLAALETSTSVVLLVLFVLFSSFSFSPAKLLTVQLNRWPVAEDKLSCGIAH